MEKIAVILFNLGAPERESSIRPFLFNLFKDPAILRYPWFFRYPLAFLISRLRFYTARKIYASIGGGSPLLANTERQAETLQARLNHMELRRKNVKSSREFKVEVVMRYWRPRAKTVANIVASWTPDQIVLLPLYPQYSTTTTASSVKEWQRYAKRAGLKPGKLICCYPELPGFIDSYAKNLESGLSKIRTKVPLSRIKLVFSAHGLPKRISDQGDPYRHQVEQSARAIYDSIKGKKPDYVVAYQSRVGPLEWIRPYMEDEIEKAGRDQQSLIIIPLTFVSEHSETLVELDREYRELAEEAGVPHYERVSTVGTDSSFISGLARAVFSHLESEAKISCAGQAEPCFCKEEHYACPILKGRTGPVFTEGEEER